MRAEDLLNRLNDRPFHPFRIHLSDGSIYPVPEPGMIIVGKSSAVLPTAFAFDELGRRLAEQWRTISLLHIVQLSDLEDSTGEQRNREAG